MLSTLHDHPQAAFYYRTIVEAGPAYSVMQHAEQHGFGDRGDRMTPERLRVEWPRAYWPMVQEVAREMEVDPYLMLAIAKQESTFRPAIQSHAGATGIMQLMPPTARWLARVDDKISAEEGANLHRPRASWRMGGRYLRRMLDRSDGNLVYALASYNAGPGNCDKWRAAMPNLPLETFVERIRFSETRDYVKKVLGNYAAYHSLYSGS